MKRRVMLLAMVTVAGCSGSVDGRVGGVKLDVNDAIFALFRDDSGRAIATLVVLSDTPKICDSLKANREPRTSTNLLLTLYRFSSDDYLAPDKGEFTVVDRDPTTAGSWASATFQRTDFNCANTLSPQASTGVSGLVKLTQLEPVANGNARATLDLTFGAGDLVKGHFNARFCDINRLPDASASCETTGR